LDQSLVDRFAVKVDKSDYHSNTEAYSFRFIGYVKDADYLIQEGWIEEVKEDKRKWWEKLDTEIPKKRIRELVERYPDEVQKEVMKHASRQMKEWDDLTKNEYTSEKDTQRIH
ncbi:MAG: hypothetical protein PHS34_09235, partial [Candidatus Omnitrophica bacterium]|nr:hypothetical protein [Candidatus Omnitrophota bacterium]